MDLKKFTSKEKAYCILAFIGTIGILFILYSWAKTPSPWTRPETEYTECLKLILNKGSIADAEMMCGSLKK